MTIDELLCKFQGKEWNGPKSGCDAADYYKEPEEWGNPDFSDDHTAMELLRWFQEEKVEMWEAFGKVAIAECGPDLNVEETIKWFIPWLLARVPADSKSYMRWVVLLAEWLRLEETIEKWGTERCPNDFMAFTSHDMCPVCNGSGKVRAEWAREEL